jgi:hypothetical protein
VLPGALLRSCHVRPDGPGHEELYVPRGAAAATLGRARRVPQGRVQCHDVLPTGQPGGGPQLRRVHLPQGHAVASTGSKRLDGDVPPKRGGGGVKNQKSVHDEPVLRPGRLPRLQRDMWGQHVPRCQRGVSPV